MCGFRFCQSDKQLRAIYVWLFIGLLTACGGGSSGTGPTDAPSGGAGNSPGVTIETEPNDRPDTAMAVSVPGAVTGSVNDTTDELDAFIITPTQTGTYLIELQGAAGSSIDLDLLILDQTQSLINASVEPDQFESITIQLSSGCSLLRGGGSVRHVRPDSHL